MVVSERREWGELGFRTVKMNKMIFVVLIIERVEAARTYSNWSEGGCGMDGEFEDGSSYWDNPPSRTCCGPM